MATAYNSSRITNKVPPRGVVGEVTSVFAEFTFPAAPVVNDTVKMFTLPKGAVLLEMLLSADDLDTNGTPAIMLQVGDGTTADLFFYADGVAKTGGMSRMSNPAKLGQVLAADTDVVAKVSTAPATGAVGKIGLAALYAMQQ